MELRHLEVFVAVAEELSFTRASTRLHLVQSGVSSAIKALERDLGAVLFDRDRHRVMLTDAGQVLLPEARATLARRPGGPGRGQPGSGRPARLGHGRHHAVHRPARPAAACSGASTRPIRA